MRKNIRKPYTEPLKNLSKFYNRTRNLQKTIVGSRTWLGPVKWYDYFLEPDPEPQENIN